VECGARTRSLPAGIRATLASIAHGLKGPGAKAGGLPGSVDAAPSGAEAQSPRSTFKGPFGLVFTAPEFEMPTPRAMATAVLSLLAFGVGIGAANIGFANPPVDVIDNVAPSVSTTPAASTPYTASTPSTASTPATTKPKQTTPVANNTGTSSTPSGTQSTTTTTASNGLPPIKHVWVITLSDQNYNQTFSRSGTDTYLSTDVAATGEIIPYYFGVGSGNLANDIAMLSGQGPTEQTAENCPDYSSFRPGTNKKAAEYGQVRGEGCVYPSSVPTIMSELQKAGYTWKAYVQGQGTKLKSVPSIARRKKARQTAGQRRKAATAARARRAQLAKQATRDGRAAAVLLDSWEPAEAQDTGKARTRPDNASELAATCRHPALGSEDPFHSGSSGYATWENPVLYFSSVVDSKNCADEDVGLSQLSKDLNSTGGPPNLSLIYPDPCDNGSNTPCSPNATLSGTAGSDSFLQHTLGLILNSAAYKADGLVILTFDQSPQSGPYAGISHYGCCSTPAYPNVSSNSLKAGATETYPVTVTETCTSTSTTTTETGTGTGTVTTGTDTVTTGTGTTTTGTTTTPQCTQTIQEESACLASLTPCSTTGGGGDVGMLAISPYIKAKSSDTTDRANHFSLLYELEDLFNLPTDLGDSANPAAQGTLASMFNNYTAP
jgi:hypothetical protein